MTVSQIDAKNPAIPATRSASHSGAIQAAWSVVNIAGDFFLVACAVLAAYYLRFGAEVFGPPLEQHRLQDYAVLLFTLAATVVLITLINGGYVFRRHTSRFDEFQRAFVAVSIATVITLAVSALFEREFSFSRSIILVAWGLAILLIWAFRLVGTWTLAELLSRGVASQRVLIVGTGEVAQTIEQKISAAPHLGYQVIGYVRERDDAAGTPPPSGLPILGGTGDIGRLIESHAVNEIIVADPGMPHQGIMAILSQCGHNPVDIKVFPDVFQIMSTQVQVGDLNGMPMLAVRDAALRGYNLAIKRAVDIAVSLFVLVFFSWFMLLIALLVKLSDPRGPVFFAQDRVGLNGEVFPTLKFRSMYMDAEARTGPVWATKGDPRVTPLGRILRRFSIDELPQFINVLIGQMSVVGPRPERPHFVNQFSQRLPRYLERHREKTGLTGWAQVNGLRGDTSIEERTAYDLWYVENWTLALDFKIMLRTVIAIFRDKNAY